MKNKNNNNNDTGQNPAVAVFGLLYGLFFIFIALLEITYIFGYICISPWQFLTQPEIFETESYKECKEIIDTEYIN